MSIRRPKVTVHRVYDVQCDWCNGTVLDGPLLTSRTEADEARRDHLKQHERDGNEGPREGIYGSEGAWYR